jgi:hypothetical protein
VTETAVFACRQSRDDRWQLGPAPGGRSWTLIGWRQTPTDPDGGVPGQVAAVLAAALAAVARITFPSSQAAAASVDWASRDGDDVRTLSGGGMTSAVRAALKRTPREIVLVSTRNSATAARLFDDGAYPWWLQGSFALLSARDDAPPELEWKQAVALLNGPTPADVDSLPPVIGGLLRPGVDGDVAGLLSRGASLEQEVLEALATECGVRGIDWTVLAEGEFIDRFG